jgi:prophage regulatory protein
MQDKRRILRLKEVRNKTGLSKSTVYSLMKKGEFPHNFKIVPNGKAVGWSSIEIDEYLQKMSGGIIGGI